MSSSLTPSAGAAESAEGARGVRPLPTAAAGTARHPSPAADRGTSGGRAVLEEVKLPFVASPRVGLSVGGHNYWV